MSIPPLTFVYKCSGQIIEFIKDCPQLHNDIKSNIGNFAILNNTSASKGVGKVTVTLKPQIHGAKPQTIKALDQFFGKFSSMTLRINLNMPHLRTHLERNNPNCDIKWNFAEGFVVVTGRNMDVQKFSEMLQQFVPQEKTTPTKNMKRSKSITDLSPSKLSLAPSTPFVRGGREIQLTYNAPDRDVLNFITSYHFYFAGLEEQCRPYGRVELCAEECKIFVYRLQPYDEPIRKQCFSVLASFLNLFATVTAKFDVAKLKALYAAKKELFKNPGPEGHPQVVASFDQAGCLTVCGERALVAGRMEMLSNYLRTVGNWSDLTSQKPSPKSQPKALLYKRSNEKFREMLKFIVSNETAKSELNKLIASFGTYEVLPNNKNPDALTIKSEKGNNTINNVMNEFFNKYTCESRIYKSQQLSDAREQFSSVFDSLAHLNVYVRWVNAPTVLIVGKKEKVAAAFALIEGVVKNVVPSPQKRRPSGETQTVNHPFIYQKAAPAFPAILKFVLHDKEETQKLRQGVQGLAVYEAIPDTKQPTALKLNPLASKADQFYQAIGPIMKRFFAQYSYIQKEYEVDKVASAKRNIAGPFWTVQHPHTFSVWNGNTFVVVGITENVQSVFKLMDEVIGSSGGASISRMQENEKKVEKETPETIKYNPKQQYQEALLYVLKYSALKAKLNEACQGVCTVSGKKIPLCFTLVKSQESKPQLLKQCIARVEAFVKSLVTEDIKLDPEDVKLFKPNQPNWLQDLRQDKSKAVGIQLGDDNFCVRGLPQDVAFVCDIIKQHIRSTSKRKPCSKDICRILINCQVIKQVNEMFAGAVVVTCSIDQELVEFKGDSRSIQAAEEQISSMKLIERSPQMTELKLEFLKNLLEKEKTKYVNMIYQQFTEESVRGALVLRDDEVILVATDGKDFTHGSSLLERIIHMNLVTVPSNSQQETTQDLVKNVSQSDEILVKEKDNIVWIVGIDENEVNRTTGLLKTFFNHSKNVILNHACDIKVAQFVAKHISSDQGFPQGVSVNLVKFGIQLLGPPNTTHKALKYLQGKKYSTETVTLCEQGLNKHFSSDQWKAYVKYVENNARCSITLLQESLGGETSPVVEEPPSSPSARMGRLSLSEDETTMKETSYSNIKIQVCHNDITKDASDAIVNGCTNDFNLSRGPLSKAILARAGKEMQTECSKNPVSKTSILRVTNGFKLNCKYVIHLVTPHSVTDYSSRIQKALYYAEVLGCSSVAVPTLGAGRIGLKEEEIAAAMAQALKEFSSSGRKTVKVIKVVVFDKKLLATFEGAILYGNASSGDLLKEGLTLMKQLARNCSPAKCNDKAKVEITFDELYSFEQAKLMVETHIQQAISKKTIKDAAIAKFTPNEWIDLYQFALDNSVTVTKQSGAITISGAAQNVSNVNDFMKKIVLEIHEAETLAKSCVWKWTKTQNKFEDFSPRFSLLVDQHFKKNSTANCTLKYEGTKITLKFFTMEFTANQKQGKIKRVVTSTESLPSSWVDLGGLPWAKVFVQRDSSEFMEVERKFRASNPLCQLIIKVERIQNKALYQQYLLKKDDVARRMRTRNLVERELFHGTSEEDAEKICANGFDRGFAGKNATLYGKGSYFAVDSSFSAAYASGNTHLSYMFLANVITGDFCRGSPNLKAPPVKVGTSDSNELYDSVVDDVTQPHIFVVFKDSSVYPTYLITFK